MTETTSKGESVANQKAIGVLEDFVKHLDEQLEELEQSRHHHEESLAAIEGRKEAFRQQRREVLESIKRLEPIFTLNGTGTLSGQVKDYAAGILEAERKKREQK